MPAIFTSSHPISSSAHQIVRLHASRLDSGILLSSKSNTKPRLMQRCTHQQSNRALIFRLTSSLTAGSLAARRGCAGHTTPMCPGVGLTIARALVGAGRGLAGGLGLTDGLGLTGGLATSGAGVSLSATLGTSGGRIRSRLVAFIVVMAYSYPSIRSGRSKNIST